MSTVTPLTLPLAGLRRGPIRRSWGVEDPGAVWPDLPATLETLDVNVEARATDHGGVRVEGELKGAVAMECRRCLDPIGRAIEARLHAWFRADELAETGEEGLWPLDPASSEIDLGEVIREELWLAIPAWAVCRPDCPGLCPRCGARLAEGPCGCPEERADARWTALDELRSALAEEDA